MSYKYKKNQKPLTFLIKDYETFSTDTQSGKVSQFAALRTDENFNILEDEKEINMFCKLAEDSLPSPMACLITGITPQLIEKHHETKEFPVYVENRFTDLISKQVGRSNTCTMGYNNFSFDDEVTRNLLFRNFRDPYVREWKSGNSRFDIYQLVMATYVLRPDLLVFPPSKDRDTGEYIMHSKTGEHIPSFRLEELSVANGIIHENAHDALNDVRATIGIAKIIKDKDPDFFNKMFDLKDKKVVSSWLSRRENKPFIFVSSFFGREDNSLGVMLKIADHPKNKNAVIAVNLNRNPENLVKLSSEEISKILYSSKSDLEEKQLERVGLQVIKINQSPMIEDLSEIKSRAKDLGLDGNKIRDNLAIVRNNFSLIQSKIIEMFNKPYENNPDIDPDRSIYAGGFFSPAEKSVMTEILTAANAQKLKDLSVTMADSRLPEMYFRFKGRNYPFELKVKEMELWNKHCVNELTKKSDIKTHYNFPKYYAEINELKLKYVDNPAYLNVLSQLDLYGKRLENKFGISRSISNNPKI
jgi:exodeoxyribonuclease-1